MKKRILALVALGVVSAVAVAGCTLGKNKTADPNSPQAEEEPTDPDVITDSEEDVFVCYYGCPRSKRLRALNTKKRKA